jgi:hypothetical protein
MEDFAETGMVHSLVWYAVDRSMLNSNLAISHPRDYIAGFLGPFLAIRSMDDLVGFSILAGKNL